jgi:hypothetical protein
MRSDGLHRLRRHVGQRERYIHARGRLGHLKIRIECEHTGHAHRRDTEGRCEFATEELDFLRAMRNIDGRARTKANAVEYRTVVIARTIVLDAAFDETVHAPR